MLIGLIVGKRRRRWKGVVLRGIVFVMALLRYTKWKRSRVEVRRMVHKGGNFIKKEILAAAGKLLAEKGKLGERK